ncbi:uncharacterized protein LOC130962027 isoform X2 [Arachis stenosperma]|uniref:uncharacterized protein LOC130962027 isoform X2 n=1 Tax=Arachis stenosperma TaxID=217475 RepID=UPI0025AC2B71|nr:uncharacterized protein LOC130962027 isoform X2 [Arachis stenosperma]
MVVEESKAAVGPVVAVEFVVIVDMVMVDKVEDAMTVVHATAVVGWVKDRNQGGGGCRGSYGSVCGGGSCYNYGEGILQQTAQQVLLEFKGSTTRSLSRGTLPPRRIQNHTIVAWILIALRQKGVGAR